MGLARATERQDPRESKASAVRAGTQGHEDTREHEDRKASKAFPAHPVGLRVRPVPLDRQAQQD